MGSPLFSSSLNDTLQSRNPSLLRPLHHSSKLQDSRSLIKDPISTVFFLFFIHCKVFSILLVILAVNSLYLILSILYYPKVSLIFSHRQEPHAFSDSTGEKGIFGDILFFFSVSFLNFNQVMMTRGYRGSRSQAVDGEASSNHEASSPQQAQYL